MLLIGGYGGAMVEGQWILDDKNDGQNIKWQSAGHFCDSKKDSASLHASLDDIVGDAGVKINKELEIRK